MAVLPDLERSWHDDCVAPVKQETLVRKRNGHRVALTLLLSTTAVPLAYGFGEDGGTVSTHHLYLTRALAACAGIPSSSERDPATSPLEADIIAMYDEMTDIGTYGGESVCDAPPYTDPAPTAVGCPDGTTVVWPTYGGSGDDPTCFSARTGLYSTVFHFPTPENLASLRAWALGTTTSLRGEASYAFGSGGSVFTATCYEQLATTIHTGSVAPGTPEAFGMYLHAVADQYSHQICCDQWDDTQHPPWCMHTKADEPEGCIATTHLLEYGCPTDAPPAGAPDTDAAPFVGNTVEAGAAEYAELVTYATDRGYQPALTSFDDRGGWLRRQVERFATRIAFSADDERIEFANSLRDVCSAGSLDVTHDIPIVDEEIECTYPLTQLSAETDPTETATDTTDNSLAPPSNEDIGTCSGCSVAPSPRERARTSLCLPLGTLSLLVGIAFLRRRSRQSTLAMNKHQH